MPVENGGISPFIQTYRDHATVAGIRVPRSENRGPWSISESELNSVCFDWLTLDMLRFIAVARQIHEPVLLSGASSLGKSQITRTLSALTGEDRFTLTCSGGKSVDEWFVGVSTSGDKPELVAGPLLMAIENMKQGIPSIVELEEVNAIKPAFLKELNAFRDALSHRAPYFELKRYGVEVVPLVPELLTIVGTYNPPGPGYRGASPLNRDMQRRFMLYNGPMELPEDVRSARWRFRASHLQPNVEPGKFSGVFKVRKHPLTDDDLLALPASLIDDAVTLHNWVLGASASGEIGSSRGETIYVNEADGYRMIDLFRMMTTTGTPAETMRQVARFIYLTRFPMDADREKIGEQINDTIHETTAKSAAWPRTVPIHPLEAEYEPVAEVPVESPSAFSDVFTNQGAPPVEEAVFSEEIPQPTVEEWLPDALPLLLQPGEYVVPEVVEFEEDHPVPLLMQYSNAHIERGANVLCAEEQNEWNKRGIDVQIPLPSEGLLILAQHSIALGFHPVFVPGFLASYTGDVTADRLVELWHRQFPSIPPDGLINVFAHPGDLLRINEGFGAGEWMVLEGFSFKRMQAMSKQWKTAGIGGFAAGKRLSLPGAEAGDNLAQAVDAVLSTVPVSIGSEIQPVLLNPLQWYLLAHRFGWGEDGTFEWLNHTDEKVNMATGSRMSKTRTPVVKYYYPYGKSGPDTWFRTAMHVV